MVVAGNNIHWRTIHTCLSLPKRGGRGGNIKIVITAEVTKPSIANVIIALVRKGRLKDKTVWLNSLPPTITGSQPSKKIMIALVAQDQNLSSIVIVNLIFLIAGIDLFFIKPKRKYGTFSTPYPHRRCCL